jgi:ABC-type Na+ efflux pump permease subunit
MTLTVLLLIFAAFDDITTDNATNFRVEYAALLVCAVWLMFLSWRLLRQGHWILGGISLVAIVNGGFAQRAIIHGTVDGWWTEYVLLAMTYLWFLVLSVMILWLAWRLHASRRRLSTRSA